MMMGDQAEKLREIVKAQSNGSSAGDEKKTRIIAVASGKVE